MQKQWHFANKKKMCPAFEYPLQSVEREKEEQFGRIGGGEKCPKRDPFMSQPSPYYVM